MDADFFYEQPLGKESLSMQLDQQKEERLNQATDGSELNEGSMDWVSTFIMEVNSSVMSGSGIRPGDSVIVERSLQAENGRIIIAQVEGELLIRKYEINNHKIRLVPDTNSLAPIEIHPGSDFSVWGVVTYVIKKVTSV